jgi:hypothetical protein
MATPGYHLRTNKAASRQIFVKALRRLETCLGLDLSTYVYCGLGGPFLEDFRLMHREWYGMGMVSFESDPEVYKRQVFHQFATNLKLEPATFDANKLPEGSKWVVWLDYTNFRIEELDLVADTLGKVGVGDIVKVTVPLFGLPTANKFLGEMVPREESSKAKEQQLLDDFRTKFGSCLPSDFTRADLTRENFPRLVARMLRLAIERGLGLGSTRVFCPIYASTYKDSTLMLNVAGVVLEKNAVTVTQVEASFRDWPLGFSSWDTGSILDISLPDLTAKERMELEKHLPQNGITGTALAGVLGYEVENLDGYAQLHHFSPLFVRIQF